MPCFTLLFVQGDRAGVFWALKKDCRGGGSGLEVNDVRGHCYVPKAAKTAIV